FAEAYGNRGNIYRKRGIIDQAIRDYDKASS
ncbi:MAG TPA: GlcNAc transferase, partial [Rhodospirillales bacterium]|nr:GlcNAc transferase [Rhodospirillales bacterium]